MRRMRRMRLGATGLAVALVLSACAGDPGDPGAAADFKPCSETECSGTLPGGAEFEILVPEGWSGSLAIFSHGLRPVNAEAASGGSDEDLGGEPTVSPSAMADGPEPAPLWEGGDKKVADTLLQAKYAIAGASTGTQGWDVAGQIDAAEELYEYFTQNVAEPELTYVWGESTGGLASVRLAELNPDWVDGAAAMCAPLAGPRPTLNLGLDVTYAVKQLLLPKLRLVGYPDAASARDAYTKVSRKIDELVERNKPTDAATLTFIAAVTELPVQTRTQDGNTPESQLRAIAEGIKNHARQSTVLRYQIEQLSGGNPSGNAGLDYADRLSPGEAAAVNNIHPKALRGMLKAMGDGKRISPDPAAEREFAKQGELSGNMTVPLLTLHNMFDPVFIVESESWYRTRTVMNGSKQNANYIDLFVIPQISYTPQDPATEGAGNCVFSPKTVVGLMIQLNDWVKRDKYPGADTIGMAFGGSRVGTNVKPKPWPIMSVSPTDPPLLSDEELQEAPEAPESPEAETADG